MDPSQLPAPTPDSSSHLPSSDDKIWIILSHLSLVIGVGFLLPLVVYFVKKEESPITAEHAKEALNFHISVYLYALISFVLCFVLIGIPLLILVAAGSFVLAIVACIKASEGQLYRYPLTIRLI